MTALLLRYAGAAAWGASRELPEQPALNERGREAIDRCRKVLQRWHDRFTPQRPAIAERYLKGDLMIRLHYRSVVWGGEEYCAVFNKLERRERKGVDVLGPVFVAHHLRDVDRKRFERAGHEVHRVVLVGVVKTPYGPERIADLECADTVENIDRLFKPALFFSPKTGFRTVGAIESGEIVSNDVPGPVDRSLPKLVERSVHVVNRIGSDGAHSEGDSFASPHDETVAEVPVHIFLGDDVIRLSGAEGGFFPFEITDVLIGPLDLDPTAGRPIAHAQ